MEKAKRATEGIFGRARRLVIAVLLAPETVQRRTTMQKMTMTMTCEETRAVKPSANFSSKLLSDLESTVYAFLHRLEGIGQIGVIVNDVKRLQQ